MSDTRKSNPAIAYGDMKTDGKKFTIEQADYGKSTSELNKLSGMEIKAEDAVVTNETKDGKIALIDKVTGKVLGYLNSNDRVVKKLEEIDKRNEMDR